MQDIFRDVKSKAADCLAHYELGADGQTRISLFHMAIKNAHALILTKIHFQSLEWFPFKFLHAQYYKEIELLTLLSRATKWSLNPLIYAEAAQFNIKFWQKAQIHKYVLGFFSLDQNFYEYLALSHAFMSEIRFIPLFPPEKPLADPFLSILHEIEVENGRQMQTQTRLLKEMELPLSLKEREKIVEEQREIVSDLFNDFLVMLCKESKFQIEER
jgi:hypothetical protein